MAKTTEVSFAVKLAAFMLNQVDEVKFSESNGFDGRCKEVVGLLPFLHMNVKKAEFLKIMHAGDGVITKGVNGICMAGNLNTKLKAVGFKCKDASEESTKVLLARFVDTIDVAYDTRPKGRKMMKVVAGCMKWQAENGIIPESSIVWCKDVKATKFKAEKKVVKKAEKKVVKKAEKKVVKKVKMD